MWPAIIFLSLVALVLIQFFWQDRRFRRQRVKAQQAFTAAALQQEKEAAARARAQQHALFDSMLEGVLVLGVNGRVQLINQSLLRIFDLPGSIEGQTMTEAFRSPDLTDLVRRLKRERRISDVELQMGHAPRRVLAVNAAAILDRDGLEQGAIFVFHDLTRIKELENTRREFVANVSHELRTPLSLIKGFTETLLDGAKDKPEVAARFLQKIERHSDRLLFLIEDLLTISKLESGEAILNIRPVPLRSLADGVLDSLASHSSARQITMENRIDEFVLASGDADSLEQVFWNLVENAIKYGKQNGTVSIEAKAGPEKFWEISVTDDGPGIPVEARDRVFERFYRIDRARSRETGGTGLGLAIVKHIVQAHGGTVGIESQPGQGARFFFTLPQAEKSAVSAPGETS